MLSNDSLAPLFWQVIHLSFHDLLRLIPFSLIAVGSYLLSQKRRTSQRQAEQLMMEMAQRIRQSLNLQEILQTTVDEVCQFLQVDRVLIFEFTAEWGGAVTFEAVSDDAFAILPFNICDPCIESTYIEIFQNGGVTAKADIYTANIQPCHVEFLAQFQVRANLVVPILKHGALWGLLVAHHCTGPRRWRQSEIELLQYIAAQAGIALQQAMLFEQVQTELAERQQTEANLRQSEARLHHLNAELEQRVEERTTELHALNQRLLLTLKDEQQAKQEVEVLYNNAPCGYHSLDADGTIIRINDTELNWLGYSRDQVINRMKFIDCITPDSRAVFYQNFPQFIQQGWINDLEFQLCHRDGSMRWISLSSTAMKDEAGNFVMSLTTLFDISDRKQTAVALQQQTRQKQLLWTISQAIRQSLDLPTILNAAVTEVRDLLGVDRSAIYRFNANWSGDFIVESVAEGWLKLIEPSTCKIWEDTYLQEHQGGRFRNHATLRVADIYAADLQACHIELLEQFQARAYAIAPIFVGDVLWGLFAIYHNANPHTWKAWEIELLQQIADQLAIAIQQAELYNQLQLELQERQQAEAVLQEAERRWRSLLDKVQLLVVGLDQFGCVNYVNPFFLRVTGYTASEVIGKNWFDQFLPASCAQTMQATFSEVLAHGTHPYYQNALLTRAGEERFIGWNNTMLQDFDGNPIGTISIGEDITERQKVEQIKNEFIGIVSHELRTPLTSIQMSLGLMQSGIYAKRPEKTQRMIEIALLDTSRLVNLVNDILDLERLESGRTGIEKTMCQAADLMQQAVDGVQALATQQAIQFRIIAGNVTIWADSDMLLQTLTNLLGNAIKFSPAQAVVTLQAERQGNGILFQVQDQGRGIPEDKLETIFGRFQQVDATDSREKGGTGLGLSICRSIIERHGGKIWAESILGEGSTFCFTLPLPTQGNL